MRCCCCAGCFQSQRPKGVTCCLVAGLLVTHVKAFLMSLVASRSCSFVSNAATSNLVTSNKRRFTSRDPLATHRNSQIFISHKENADKKHWKLASFGKIDQG